MENSMVLEKGISLGPTKKKQCHKRRGKSFWIKTISDFEGGALSMQDFCAERGLAVSTFHAWRRRLSTAKSLPQEPAKAASITQPQFLPVYVTSPETPLDKTRQPDVLLGSQPPSTDHPKSSREPLSNSSSGLTLCLNGNLKISIDKDFHGATLQRLMNHLASQGLETC
jgi:hypothetical protein